MAKLDDRKNLIYKEKDRIVTLSEFQEEYLYETDHIVARFNKKDFRIIDVNFLTPCARKMHFKDAAEMSILMNAADGLTIKA